MTKKLNVELVYFTHNSKTSEPFVHNSHYPFLYLKTFALKNEEIKNSVDITFKTFDQKEPIKNIIKKTIGKKIGIIGFSCYVWNINHTLKVCKKIKDNFPDINLILGGPDIIETEKILKENQFIDICVRGEGEEIFEKVLLSYLGKMKLKDIEGVSFRENNKIVVNSGSGFVKDLNTIPSVFTKNFVSSLKDEVFYEISRGCYFKCKYCTTYTPRRYFVPDRINKELQLLLSNKSIKCIDFIDADIDLLNINYTKKLLSTIKKHNKYNIEFVTNCAFQAKDENFYTLLKECNFRTFLFGIQTTNENILRNIGRQWVKSNIRKQTIKNIRQYLPDVALIGSIILGLPGDNYNNFKETLNWCQKMCITHFTICHLLGLPGTEFKINTAKYGIKFQKRAPYKIYYNKTFPRKYLIKARSIALWFYLLMTYTWSNRSVLNLFNENNIFLTDIADQFPVLNDKQLKVFGQDESIDIYIGNNVRRDKQINNFIYKILKNLSLNDVKVRFFLEKVFLKKSLTIVQ